MSTDSIRRESFFLFCRISGVIFRCLTPVLVIAAVLTGKPICMLCIIGSIVVNGLFSLIFVRHFGDLSVRAPREKREIADQIKMDFYQGTSKSDHITMFKFFRQWKLCGRRGSKQFAWYVQYGVVHRD